MKIKEDFKKKTKKKGRPADEIRNELIIELKERNPRLFTFRTLSHIFKIGVRAVWEIYDRDKHKYSKKIKDKKIS